MTPRPPAAIRTVPHEVHRLTIDVGAPFDEFRARYEHAVPPLDAARLDALKAAAADWQAILRAAADNAPHGFIVYWSYDATPLMRLAGNSRRCVEYLMGNHTIAERMYRHDPAIMLYAPLRTAIYDDAAGTTWFTIDQPSTRFASFDTPAITAVGLELDRKLAALLDVLDAPVPPALAGGGAVALEAKA
jgi:hypothetical protein